MQDHPDSTDFSNEDAWLEAGRMRRGQPVAFAAVASAPVAGSARFAIDWIDANREATSPANPDYPNGAAIDVALDAVKACRAELPCPAKRCGLYVVRCTLCGYAIALSTTGRADDPCSVRVPCRA